MKIIHINWLSQSAKEAEVEISAGTHQMMLFSHPCEYLINQEVLTYIHPLEVENFRISFESDVAIIKLKSSYYGYKIIGLVDDFENAIISVGGLKFELNSPIPAWAKEGDLIEFESSRFDLW